MAIYRMLLVGVAMFVSTAGYAGDKTASFELVFITSDYCPFCKAWEREVGLPILMAKKRPCGA